MHVGLYTPSWPPGESPNGISTYVGIMRAELLRLGHEVSIFSADCEPNLAERNYRVDSGDTDRPIFRGLQRLIGRGWKSEYDFGPRIARAVTQVHARHPLDVFEMEESFGWCRHVAQSTSVPLVVKLHGPAFQAPTALRRKALDEPVQVRVNAEGAGLRAAQMIVAPSRSTMLGTVREYDLPLGAVTYVPNPVNELVNVPVWRSKSEWAENLLFVGRFDHGKGGDAIIKIFGKLAQSRPRLRLTFVGPDEGVLAADGTVQKFADYVNAHLQPASAARIHFLGTRPAREVQALRLQCAVTLLATRRESFGYVAAEAMMQGCPIAAFDVPGVNELIEHGKTGLLAPLDDANALVGHINHLLDHPEEAVALGANARAAISIQCGAEKVAKQMLNVYRLAAEVPNAARS